SLYREILLSGKYSLLEYKENVFLIKNKNNVKFSNDELKELDEILSNANLNFLPEVWANSINTLPVKKITPKFYSYIEDNKITVKFYNNEKVKDVNLLMISVKEPEIFNIKINNSQSELKCKSKTGKVLIPLDNFPSWLLNENFNEITITAVGNNTDDYNIEFYTRD
ncbi:MAG: hypothetical protein LUH05_08905, partial [Candidatus Gastranaerophilales bacterium]|nr:hypothetical protein [Candidatus Gastranaerophilales bacterium]